MSNADQFLSAAKGYGRALRYESDPPLPDEPYMSMQDAANIHAQLVERLQERVNELEAALGSIEHKAGLAFDTLGNSGRDFKPVQTCFAILRGLARQALKNTEK